MISDKFVILGFVINLVGDLSYVIHTLQNKTRPNRVSWFMWALAPLIAFAAEIHEGVGIQSLMTFIVGFGPLLVLIASFVNRKSVWKITKFDIACGALSFLGLICWALTRHGNVAIAFSILADGLAAIPTLKKSFYEPDSESYLVFLFGGTNAAITILTIHEWSFAVYAFPIYILSICAIFVALVRFKLGLRLQGKPA